MHLLLIIKETKWTVIFWKDLCMCLLNIFLRPHHKGASINNVDRNLRILTPLPSSLTSLINNRETLGLDRQNLPFSTYRKTYSKIFHWSKVALIMCNLAHREKFPKPYHVNFHRLSLTKQLILSKLLMLLIWGLFSLKADKICYQLSAKILYVSIFIMEQIGFKFKLI